MKCVESDFFRICYQAPTPDFPEWNFWFEEKISGLDEEQDTWIDIHDSTNGDDELIELLKAMAIEFSGVLDGTE